MKDFRGPLPLEDRDFAEVRRNVLAKSGRRPVAPFAFRLASVAAAVAILVFLLMPRPTVPTRIPQARSPVLHKETVVAEAQPVKPKPTPKPRHKPQLVASTGAPPPDSEITMNIETADPNVRIIWIAR